MTVGPNGVVYGTTVYGGAGGYGTVFVLHPPATSGGPWTHTVIYNFQGAADGAYPAANLILDRNGNLYGTTQYGGGDGNCPESGCGTVFELSPPTALGGAWTETVLHRFGSGSDGAEPWAGLVFDRNGNLYGSTAIGSGTGCFGAGCGIAFQLKPPSIPGAPWMENILHTFTSGNDGGLPYNLVFGKYGALYTTTNVGGGSTLCGPQQIGCGTVVAIAP